MSPVPRRRAISTPGERPDPIGRSRGSIVASVALHVVVIGALVQIAVGPAEWMTRLMDRTPAPVERIGFLQLPKGEPPKEAPRRGGDDRPASAAPNAPSVPVPPAEVPRSLPPIPSIPPRTAPEMGTGPLVGGGGDTKGVRPSFSDPRIWAPVAPVVTAPLSNAARLDSAMLPAYEALVDSMRRANGGRDPKDWTFKIGGQKYGIDQKYIRLGPVSIPTAALAFLPLNVQGNPAAIERDRKLQAMRDEITFQAAKAARDEDFQKAVKQLRERKQRERDDAKKADEPPVKIVP